MSPDRIIVPPELARFAVVAFEPVVGSGWAEGDAIVEAVLQSAGVQQALAEFDRLEAEITGMPLASRFSPTRVINAGFSETSGPIVNPDASEADHKRDQLLGHLRLIRGTLMDAYSRLESLVLDKEAASREF